jgi:hypothetical protein
MNADQRRWENGALFLISVHQRLSAVKIPKHSTNLRREGGEKITGGPTNHHPSTINPEA